MPVPVPEKNWLKANINITVLRTLVAEFFGTLFLVLVGCGSVTGRILSSNIEIAFCFGLILGIVVEILEPVSGGHVNPAVTIAMLIIGNISIIRAILYIIAQFLGAIVGAAVLFGVTPNALRSNLGQTTLSDVSPAQGLGIEILITFVLVFTVLSFIDVSRIDAKVTGAIVVGLSVAACHLWAIKYTGASMNTARSFGPAVIMNNAWGHHWVYWLGPNLGGAIAGAMYRWVYLYHRKSDTDINSEDAAATTTTTP